MLVSSSSFLELKRDLNNRERHPVDVFDKHSNGGFREEKNVSLESIKEYIGDEFNYVGSWNDKEVFALQAAVYNTILELE